MGAPLNYALKAQIEDVGKLHDQDLVYGYDGVYLEGSHVTEKQGFLRKIMNIKGKRRISHQIRRISTKIDDSHSKFDEFTQNSTN